jgi:addiction module RelB/DinJ family antitoxin
MVEATLSQLGLSTSEAINVFLRRVILKGVWPFDVQLPNK